MRRLLATFATLLLGGGCSLVVSTSGLGGGDADPRDATSELADVATTDAASDAPADRREESTVPFCKAASHAFCDDFDRIGTAATGWTSNDVASGASLSISTTRATSLPGALLAMHPARPADATTATYATLSEDLDVTAKRVTVAFDLYLPKPAFAASSSNMGVMCFSIRVGGNRDGVCMSVGESYVAFGMQDGAPLAFDAWVHVLATIEHGGMATATIGTATYAAVPGRVVESSSPPGVFMSLGLHAYNQPAPAFAAYYDNVTIDVF